MNEVVLPIRHGGVKHAAITSRSAVHVADAASDARFNRKSDAMLGLVTNSVLMVPIFESRAAAVERGIAVSGAAGGAKSDARRKLIGLIEVHAWARVGARACVCETEQEKATLVHTHVRTRMCVRNRAKGCYSRACACARAHVCAKPSERRQRVSSVAPMIVWGCSSSFFHRG